MAPAQRDGAEIAIAIPSSGTPEFSETDRCVRYVFSTPEVGRDQHAVASDAWQLDNFRRDPVFLWAHDDSLPPIGRVIEIGDVDGALKGTVEYAERDLNPFADLIYKLVRARYINAVSTSWIPLEGTMSRDRSRPKGVDFSKVDLLEISQVPVPALPSALAQARSVGIDTTPLYQWAERILDRGGMVVMSRGELENLRSAAKMPAATQRREGADGANNDQQQPAGSATPTAAAAAPAAAAVAAEPAASAVDAGAAAEARGAPAAVTRARRAPVFRRGLYECGQLGYLLMQLGYMHNSSVVEEALEQDADSALPRLLGEALQAAADAFLEMADEEVQELLEQVSGGEDDIPDGERGFIARAGTPRAKAFRRGVAFMRAGRKLSNDTQERLGTVHSHLDRAMRHHRAQGEHQEAVSQHIEEARAAHKRATSSLADLGYDHHRVKRAMGDMSDRIEELADRHADATDSHSMVGRSVKSAQRTLHSVTDGAVSADEDDDKEPESRAARVKRAQRLKAVPET